MDDPKYVSNNIYTGIDLINDSLSTNHNVYIYDEVFSKQSHSDPIMNQLNLFHKWIDRHRDMCEKWNHNEDMLNKLNEE
ncbi:hypothetical protein PFFCH_00313 [Plasmodium falciparum FCH/4]|uniref:Plasmodium falciparum erythrocyte membrane protein 1 acidic terminal segment domain-containing protein n=1 Tax=Plasmodium falciparum FCH/4 TaxID=1036724 RepID=A0A024VVC1_PLAFA|nr:hypothetical protein PFFCH_00313 [Plasmodium falciparum FCH/4]